MSDKLNVTVKTMLCPHCNLPITDIHDETQLEAANALAERKLAEARKLFVFHAEIYQAGNVFDKAIAEVK